MNFQNVLIAVDEYPIAHMLSALQRARGSLGLDRFRFLNRIEERRDWITNLDEGGQFTFSGNRGCNAFRLAAFALVGMS